MCWILVFPSFKEAKFISRWVPNSPWAQLADNTTSLWHLSLPWCQRRSDRIILHTLKCSHTCMHTRKYMLRDMNLRYEIPLLSLYTRDVYVNFIWVGLYAEPINTKRINHIGYDKTIESISSCSGASSLLSISPNSCQK
jgi:hypothetical protein